MLLISMSKYLVLGFITITLSGAAIGTGILFAGYSIAVAKNPDEADSIFSTTLMAFALIETFVFISILIGVIVFLLYVN